MDVKVGVALSSGGAAGLAHIGVLEALREAGIEVECVAGTSAGAMVGAAFAADCLADFRQRVATWSRRHRMRLFDPIWPRSGLLGGRRALDLLGACAAQRIEALPRRFAAVATDLDSGRRAVLRNGVIGDAVRASIAIPGVFSPLCHRGRLLVDGALVDPIPIGPTRDLGATFVIASSVIGSAETALTTRCYAARSNRSLRGLFAGLFGAASIPSLDLDEGLGEGADREAAVRSDGLTMILYKASAVVQTTIAAARLREEPPDFLIAPAAHDIGLFELQRGAEAIEAGRAAVRAALPELQAAIADVRRGRAPMRWWTARESESAAA